MIRVRVMAESQALPENTSDPNTLMAADRHDTAQYSHSLLRLSCTQTSSGKRVGSNERRKNTKKREEEEKIQIFEFAFFQDLSVQQDRGS